MPLQCKMHIFLAFVYICIYLDLFIYLLNQ